MPREGPNWSVLGPNTCGRDGRDLDAIIFDYPVHVSSRVISDFPVVDAMDTMFRFSFFSPHEKNFFPYIYPVHRVQKRGAPGPTPSCAIRLVFALGSAVTHSAGTLRDGSSFVVGDSAHTLTPLRGPLWRHAEGFTFPLHHCHGHRPRSSVGFG